MAITEDQVKDALKSVKYPGFSRDIVSFGLIKGIDLRNGDVTVQLALATNDAAIPQTIKNEAETALRALADVREAKVRIDIQAHHCDRQRQRRRRQINRRSQSGGRARANEGIRRLM